MTGPCSLGQVNTTLLLLADVFVMSHSDEIFENMYFLHSYLSSLIQYYKYKDDKDVKCTFIDRQLRFVLNKIKIRACMWRVDYVGSYFQN